MCAPYPAIRETRVRPRQGRQKSKSRHRSDELCGQNASRLRRLQMTVYRYGTVGEHKLFHREAGLKASLTILLLHGFPTSLHMFRNLIPALADRYHLVAPDLPGFSDAHNGQRIAYTFENLAKVTSQEGHHYGPH